MTLREGGRVERDKHLVDDTLDSLRPIIFYIRCIGDWSSSRIVLLFFDRVVVLGILFYNT